MAEAALSDLAMESRLAQAIRQGEFVLHFQPQVAPHDGRLTGVEALLRWAHPQRGLVMPDEFIPLAEDRRLILPIGHWVLHHALAAARRWRDAGWPALPVAVNLSSQQFQIAAFADMVEAALDAAEVEGRQLELELTERMLMDDLDPVRQSLLRLRSLGVAITVDDFGTGYTSLAHLKDLPLDRLKIDRSFITGVPGDRGAAAIARAIVQMGHGLNLQVLAEGVESAAQLAWAQAHGCDALQGYMVAPPMPEAQLHEWLKEAAANKRA
jgi:EAL domain-containing protein (putative c-di-GMP-specific phosphodiesterase class I)